MKVNCFYAVIEQPGNVAQCHLNEVKEFRSGDEFRDWVEFIETELCPDGSTQIVLAATDSTTGSMVHAYIGEPKGDGNDICTVFGIADDDIQCPNRAKEFPFEDMIEDINSAWLEPGWELRKVDGRSAAICEMHMQKVGEI